MKRANSSVWSMVQQPGRFAGHALAINLKVAQG
jgi:hypothetical protein